MNVKIALTVFAVFLISFLILFSVNDWYQTNFDRTKWEEVFYSQDFDPNKKKLYIIGSSFVVRINQTYIEDYLSKNGQAYEVYNLGIPLDVPNSRIQSLDMILESKPDVVVYGLGFRDLRGDNFIEETDQFTIPTAQKDESKGFQPRLEFLEDLLIQKDVIHVEIPNLKNPKFVSLQILEMIWVGKSPTPPITYLPKHPFQGQESLPLLTNKELAEKYKNLRYTKNLDLHGENAQSLKIIISKLKEKNIEVILLLVPFHEIYLDTIPNEDLRSYLLFFEDLAKEYNIKIIDLHDRYSNYEIWNDWRHIGYNTKSSIYYNDISQGIFERINS